MLDKAHPDSLMLFDELGAGTDPVEGAALAVSLIEYTRSRGAVTAATTHYAELKEYAISTEGVENASCEFDVNTLKPTYRLLIGIPGKSNAFAISKRLGLSDEIIENAKKMIDSDDRRFEDVVSTLEQQRRAMEEDRAETARLRLEAEQASKNASKYLSEIESERKKARDRANAEARQIVENVRAEVDSVLRELSELRKMSSEEDFNEKLNKARSDLRRRLNTAEDELRPYTTKAKAARPVRPIVAGDTVRMVNIGSNAYVITPPDSSGNLTVQAGIMKVTLNIDEVELVDTDHAENATKMYRQSLRESRRIRQVNDEAAGDGVGVRSSINELDIRGMASDEAILELERFIDNALLSGLTSLTIIHGKGTGTLRAAVQRNLRSNRHVKSFRPGRYGEGETGVTIVELTN
jgi:DNA mismatch repair protein MutS2